MGGRGRDRELEGGGGGGERKWVTAKREFHSYFSCLHS